MALNNYQSKGYEQKKFNNTYQTKKNFYNNRFPNKWQQRKNRLWLKKQRLFKWKLMKKFKRAEIVSKKRSIHLTPNTDLTFNSLANQFFKQAKQIKSLKNTKISTSKSLFEKNKASLIRNKRLFNKSVNSINTSSFIYKDLQAKNRLTTKFSINLQKINPKNLTLGPEEALSFSINNTTPNQFIINVGSLTNTDSVFLSLKKYSKYIEVRFVDALGFFIYDSYIVDPNLFNSILITRSLTSINIKKIAPFKNNLLIKVSLSNNQNSSVKLINEFFKSTSLKGFNYSFDTNNVLIAQTIIFKLLLTSNDFKSFLRKYLSSTIKNSSVKNFKFNNKVYSQFIADSITSNQKSVNIKWLKRFTKKSLRKLVIGFMPPKRRFTIKKLFNIFIKIIKLVKKSKNFKTGTTWFFRFRKVCTKLQEILSFYGQLRPLLSFKKRKFRIKRKAVPIINKYNTLGVDSRVSYFVRNLLSLPSQLFTQKILLKAFRQTYKLVKKKVKPFNWKRRFWRNIRLAYKVYFYTRTYNHKKKQKIFEFKKVIKRFKFKPIKRSNKNRKLLKNVWYIKRDLNGKRSRLVSNLFDFDKSMKISNKIKRSRKPKKRSYKKRTYQNFNFSERGKWKSLKGRYLRRLKLKQYFFQFYGNLQWRQFHKVFNQVRKRHSHRTQNWLFNFEKRLHTLLLRLKIASTSGTARQLIQHGHIMVHNKKVNRKNYVVKNNDLLFYISDRLQEKVNLKPYKFSNLYRRHLIETPSYLNVINMQIPNFARISLSSNEETFNWLNTTLKQDIYKKLQSFWSTNKINISRLSKQIKTWKYELPDALQYRFKTAGAFKDRSIYFRLNKWKTRRGSRKQLIFFRTARRFKRWSSYVSKTLLKLKALNRRGIKYTLLSTSQKISHSNLNTNKKYIYKLENNLGKLQNFNNLFSLRKNRTFYPKLRRRFKYMRYLKSTIKKPSFSRYRLNKKFKLFSSSQNNLVAKSNNTKYIYKPLVKIKVKKYRKLSKKSKTFRLSIATKNNKEVNFYIRVKKKFKIKKSKFFNNWRYRKPKRFHNRIFKKRRSFYYVKKRKEERIKKRIKQKIILNLIKKRTFLSQKNDQNHLLLQYKRKYLMKHNRVQSRRRRKMYKLNLKQNLSLKTKMRRWLKSQYKKKSFFWERELTLSKYSKFLKLFKKKIKKKKFLKHLYRGWAFKQIYFFFNSKRMEFLRKKLKSSLFCWRKKQVLRRQIFQNSSLRLFIGFLSPFVTQRIISSYSETSFTPLNGLNEIKWYA